MYWPIGAPRRYAYGHDQEADERIPPSAGNQDNADDEAETTATSPEVGMETPAQAAEKDTVEILDLRIARNGAFFGTITSGMLAIWQVRPTAVLTSVIRSKQSLETYGPNKALYIRPDTAVIVVQTSTGYLITYSLLIEPDSRLYVKRITAGGHRRKSSLSGPGADDHNAHEPGNVDALRDASLRFRMVIKVDAGIQRALALDDELVVATEKPAAVQSIRWTPDGNKNQTTTELLSKLLWLPKKVTIIDMVYDRPMNLTIWIASDGSVYAVTKAHKDENLEEITSSLHGFCFHKPADPGEIALKVAVNARFSLIAVACASGETKVFAAKDYSGNIPLTLRLSPVVSPAHSGTISCLSYSPDGHCLFIGYERGWSMWSVYGQAGANSFMDNHVSDNDSDLWLHGIRTVAWIGGGNQLLILCPRDESLWILDMIRSAATSCFSSANIARAVMQTDSAVYIYRGNDLETPTDLPSESALWQAIEIPSSYLSHRWPLKSTAISLDGRYIAVAGKKGLAHYSVASGRWKGCERINDNDAFTVRGGMCWYQHLLIAAVDTGRQYELRLYSRELPFSDSSVLHRELLSSPAVLLSISGENSLLVYTHENILYHFVITTSPVGLVMVGQMGFNGIVRAPARVRAINWLLPASQISDGDPSQDVKVASVLFLVDGKLVLLQPHTTDDGDAKYDLKVIAQNVEIFMLMRDCLPCKDDTSLGTVATLEGAEGTGTVDASHGLDDSLWVFDGIEIRMWRNMAETVEGLSSEYPEIPAPTLLPVDSYPLSVLSSKGLVLGIESEISQRRNSVPSSMRISTRTSLFLPHILRKYIHDGNHRLAFVLSQSYENLSYYSHALELLLHNVLDEEVDSPTNPSNLPAVLEFVSNSPQYLDIIVQCTRKTEVRSWKTLFSHLPPVIELFDESLRRDMLKTAGGYLLVLHTLDQHASHGDQTQRLLLRAVDAQDWALCKELARFLAAMDASGSVLREAVKELGVQDGMELPIAASA